MATARNVVFLARLPGPHPFVGEEDLQEWFHIFMCCLANLDPEAVPNDGPKAAPSESMKKEPFL